MKNENKKSRKFTGEKHEAAVKRGDVIELNDGGLLIKNEYLIKLYEELVESQSEEINRMKRFINNHIGNN